MEVNPMIRSTVFALLVALALGVGSPASADEFSYRMGRDLGERVTASAWRSIRRDRGCRGASDLRAVIQRAARRITRASRSYERRDMIDYSRGYVRGLWDALEEASDDCSSRCDTFEDLAEYAVVI